MSGSRSGDCSRLPELSNFGSPPAKPGDYLFIYTISLVREREIPFTYSPQINSETDAVRIVSKYFAGLDREHFIVLLLDAKNRMLGLNTVAIGSLTSAIVQPRKVLKPAILANAVSILVAHNHPSGDPTPSFEDQRLTWRLQQAAELLGIKLLDHIIIGADGHYDTADPLEAKEKQVPTPAGGPPSAPKGRGPTPHQEDSTRGGRLGYA